MNRTRARAVRLACMRIARIEEKVLRTFEQSFDGVGTHEARVRGEIERAIVDRQE